MQVNIENQSKIPIYKNIENLFKSDMKKAIDYFDYLVMYKLT